MTRQINKSKTKPYDLLHKFLIKQKLKTSKIFRKSSKSSWQILTVKFMIDKAAVFWLRR